MERSRRSRLSELYGDPVGYKGTPGSTKFRERAGIEESFARQRRTSRSRDGLPKDEGENAGVNHHKRQAAQDTRIPATILDIGSQRAFALAIFAIIESYKLYDLILLKNGMPLSSAIGLGFLNQHLHFLVKYFIYEATFLYFLPEFRIPSLTFSKIIVILQIALFLLINLFLVSDLSFPLTSVMFAAWKKLNSKDLTILGSSVDSAVFDASSHFKGSHTIKILPENTIQLNPFHDSFCLPQGATDYQLNVPIRLNSTSDIDFLQVKYTDFETNQPILMNYTSKDIKRFDTSTFNALYERDTLYGPMINYLNLPVNKLGLYEVVQALDSKFLSLRTYYSPLVVVNCPTAAIDNFAELSQEKCKGDSYSVKFIVEGVPPLKLKYKKFINNNVQTFSDQSLQPEFFQSPLLGYSSEKVLSKEHLSDLKWATSRTVEIDFDSPVNEIGDYNFKIEEITDGLGNLVNFTNTLNDDSELFNQYSLMQSFYSHDLPRVHLEERVNRNTKTKRSLRLAIDHFPGDSAPFEAQIKYISDDESEVELFTYLFKDDRDEYPVQKPGTYTLVSVKSKHCRSIISGRSSVSIPLPVVPKLTIESQPIQDSCVGQVGLVFDMAFVGTPPFKLHQTVYKIENGKRVNTQSTTLTSQGTRFRFNYEPSVEGNYEIAFNKLVDSLYSDPIELQPARDYTFTTSMRVKPSAEIKHYQNRGALCLGSSVRIPVQLKGEAPFVLEYDVIETQSNKRIPYTVKDIKGDSYEIETPAFKVGGEYILSLTSVKDNSGCLVSLTGADAKIAVRREVPSVGFGVGEDHNKIKIKKGETTDVPLRLLGEGPFDVDFDFYNSEGLFVSSKKKHFHSAHKGHLTVSEAGTYKLKSVKDSSCRGTVSDTDSYAVEYHPIPSVSISEHSDVKPIKSNVFEKNNACQMNGSSVDLVLHGSAPFVVEYTVLNPSGARSSKSLSVATRFASLRFPNDKPGEYKYFITGVYDALYSKYDLDKIHYSMDEIVVKQVVSPSPRAEFKNKRKVYRTCTTNVLDKDVLEPIPLNIDGNVPITVTFEVIHESSSKSEFITLSKITSTSDLKDLYRGLKLGNHMIRIVKVIDAGGCIQTGFSDNGYVSISITDTPKINQLDSSINYCVGDHIGYQLIGTPPFSIVYGFNDLTLKATETSSQFSRLAAEPGTISIKSLKDSASNCVVNFTLPENRDKEERLSIIVHPIPSVEVSQGDYTIQDIHEGDQAEIIFSFEGTLPFSLTYVRTEQVASKRGKSRSQVVETHTVNDIYSYEYRVLTSLQGTYQAVEVSDAYCVARND